MPLILRQRRDMSTSFKECHSNVRQGPRQGPRQGKACQDQVLHLERGGGGPSRRAHPQTCTSWTWDPPLPHPPQPQTLVPHGRENKTRSHGIAHSIPRLTLKK